MFRFFNEFGGLILFVIFFSSCTACVISEDNDRQFCKPVCAPYTAKYKTVDGECICDMSNIIRK
jgi:hypothetical protein